MIKWVIIGFFYWPEQMPMPVSSSHPYESLEACEEQIMSYADLEHVSGVIPVQNSNAYKVYLTGEYDGGSYLLACEGRV